LRLPEGKEIMADRRKTGVAGHARPEIMVSFAIVMISISLATPFFNRYGFSAWIIGSVAICIGVAAGLFVMAEIVMAISRINMKLSGKAWYRSMLKIIHIATFLAGFSFFGVIILTPQVFFLDLSKHGQELFLSIGPIIIGIAMTVFRFRSEERFWNEFGRFCLFLMSAFICELILTPIGISVCTDSPHKSVYFSIAGIVIPMGVYFFQLRRRLKEPLEPE